ncbi:hypothetical protein DOY81_011546 [Sarcophaga bullata]|nr:hypothetical protein DOY81_011546 [Sarcophaga bullata]
MDHEYEIEHFGFTAEQCSLERKYFLQKIIRNALDAMLKKFNTEGETLNHLQKAKEEVFQNIWSSMYKEIEAASQLDKKYFTIPDHVLLPADFDHVKSYTEQDEQELDKQLEQLKTSFLENSIMLASLNLENSQYKNFSSFVDMEVKTQQKLKEALNNINQNKIQDLVHKTNSLNKTTKRNDNDLFFCYRLHSFYVIANKHCVNKQTMSSFPNKNPIILSNLVIEGLGNLGSVIPLVVTKKIIANSVKLTLHPEATITPVPEIYAKNSDKAKQSEYAIVTLYSLAIKHSLDVMALRQLMEEQNVNAVVIEEITRTYEEQRKALFLRQIQVGHSFPHITDLQWRIVADVKSSTSDHSSEEVGFYINMGRYKQKGGDRETIVEFVCNTEELQLLINKLKEIERHCVKESLE